MRRETIALHTGYEGEDSTRAVAVPIYQTVSYDFESAEHAAALFNLEADGYRYSRISNPTNAVLERRVAALEGGVEAMAVASGQAALHCAISNLVEPGRNIVSVPQLYGTTHSLFSHHFPSIGIRVLLAESDRPEDVAKLIDENTRAIFCESVGNPAGNIADIAALAKVAHDNEMPLVVDNTVPTPVLCRPIEHGADIIVHSLTKFMGGHGTTLGGIVVDGGNFPWARYPSRFPMFTRPDSSYHGLVYTERFGRAAYIARCRSVFLRTLGAVLSPMSAFMLLQGIETVSIRIERHVENAAKVAAFLRDDPRVEWINYTGFETNPYHDRVRTYLDGSACSLMTFGVEGGYSGGVRFYNALKMIRRVVNLGDTKSLACHPASTTHRQMPVKDQLKAGVTPSTIRVSVGIEHIDDILADLDQALTAATDQRQNPETDRVRSDEAMQVSA
jgi:O-acetylhomoserine (thiol)-lyase